MSGPNLPNHLHYDHEGVLVGMPLGEVHHVGPSLSGGLSVWLKYGSRLDLTPADMRKVLDEGAMALGQMPWSADGVHDAVEVPDAS